jgi:phosphoglycolate phosphatase
MRKIRSVVLDVDGTVVTCPYDFAAMRAAVARIAAAHGVEVAELGARGVLEQIEAVGARVGEGESRFREEAERAVAEIEVSAAEQAQFLPGAAEALRGLRAQGVAVALITRNCRAVTAAVLGEWRDYDVLLTRNDVPAVKPDPDHVRRALGLIDGAPQTAAMVGDHAFDMQAGRAARMRVCVGVRTGNSRDESLLSAGAHAVIESVAQLPEWLAGYEEAG